jgi:hypothetical protein
VLPSGESFKTTKGAPHIILQLIDDQKIVQVNGFSTHAQYTA